MALNHEVHIPEVMSIIFFLAFFPNPQSRTPNLDHSALVPPFFSSNGKGEGKGYVNTLPVLWTQGGLLTRHAIFEPSTISTGK